MKKENTILLILVLIALYSFKKTKKLKGSVMVEPVLSYEFLPDDYNAPDYQD